MMKKNRTIEENHQTRINVSLQGIESLKQSLQVNPNILKIAKKRNFSHLPSLKSSDSNKVPGVSTPKILKNSIQSKLR